MEAVFSFLVFLIFLVIVASPFIAAFIVLWWIWNLFR